MKNASRHRSQPKLLKARTWLCERGIAFDDPGRPSIESLARACGVSRMVMWKALHTHGEPTGSRVTDIEQRLLTDIQSATFPRGSRLPVLKVLADRYGASYSTLTSALGVLVARGVLVRRGRGYHVYQSPSSSHTRPTVLCLTTPGNFNRFARSTPRSADFWRTIEHECCRHEIQFEVRSLWEVEETAVRRRDVTCSIRRMMRERSLVGVIVWSLSGERTHMRRVAAALAESGVQVSMLFESGLDTAEALVSSVRHALRVRLFTLGLGPACGRAVGRFLAGAGHRKVAFFGTRCDDPRGRGLEEALADAGLELPVLSLSPSSFATDTDYQQAMADSDAYSSLRGVLDACVQQAGATLSDTLRMHMPGKALPEMAYLQECMQPLFEKALARRDVTAWVGTTDSVAFLALDFLAARAVDVPRRVSVVGFDDTIESFDRGLTSYSFNAPACAVAVLDHILSPESLRRLYPPGLIEVPGTVMVRRTTCRRSTS